jgi:2-oxoglutarate/2-oxoacid ferredoxin oxidoreductase subunit alpha
MFGNECIAKGAIEAGMDFYAAYPMTPASSLIDVVTTDNRVTFFQGEDEIAVSMAMLGAKVAGKRSMCGTSGGGFALMTESIAFSNQAEIGGVYVLAQRDGPSTGTPTYTGQADLAYALNASFGDTFPIVLAPSTFEEGYRQIGKALNWSDIYQHPVILLTDKQFSEGYIAINPKDLKAEEIKRGKLVQGTEGYKRYEFTKD